MVLTKMVLEAVGTGSPVLNAVKLLELIQECHILAEWNLGAMKPGDCMSDCGLALPNRAQIV